MTDNMQAFLDMLSVSEGTSTSPATRRDGYDVIVIGVDGKREIFTDFKAHPFAGGRPSKIINAKGLTSNASGRYQFMLVHWPFYRDHLKLPDFSPRSQDLWAIQLLRERGSIPDIEAGRFADAVSKCRNIWASLPGANYPGQPMHPIAQLQAVYVRAGGVLA